MFIKIALLLILFSCNTECKVTAIFYADTPGLEGVCRYNCSNGKMFIDFCDRYTIGQIVSKEHDHISPKKCRGCTF